MRELVTVMTRKGQITVPVEVRRALQLKQGDKVVVVLPDDQEEPVTLRRYTSVAERTFGSVKPKSRPEDLDSLRRQAAEDAAEAAVRRGLGDS